MLYGVTDRYTFKADLATLTEFNYADYDIITGVQEISSTCPD